MLTVLPRQGLKVLQPCQTLNAETVVDFQASLVDVIASDEYSLILIDMSQIDVLDRNALMALVSAQTLARNHQQTLGLCCLSPAARIVLEVTQLDQVFEIFAEHPTLVSQAA